MNEPKETNSAIEGVSRTSEQQESNAGIEGFSRRTFLGVGSAGLASAALASMAVAVNAQERTDTEKAEQDHSASNPGPENKPLLDENPISNFPHPWHRTRPRLEALAPNRLTNTPLKWRLWLPRSKRRAVKFAWLTRVTSWPQNISLQS